MDKKFLKSIGATNAKLGDDWLTTPGGDNANRLDLSTECSSL